MPIYDYRCPAGHVFEVLLRGTDSEPAVCAECGAGPVAREMGSAASVKVRGGARNRDVQVRPPGTPINLKRD